MRLIKFIFFYFTFGSCVGVTNFKNQNKIPATISLEIGFYPSFALPITLKITKNNDTGYLTCKVFKYNTADKIVSYDSVLLSKKDFDTFFKIVDTVSLLKMTVDNSNRGTDGITVQASIVQNGEKNKFEAWSPSRNEKPALYKFLDVIFDLINKKLPKEENYIENVQDYFSYGLGIKLKSENPTVIKMYGGYSIDDATKLQLFFDSLPRDKPIIMDMSNFGGMGTILDDYFAVCDGTHEKMIWVTPGHWKNYFTRVGIDTSKMVPDIETAKKMIAQ